MAKTPHHLPAGKLLPLPISKRRWPNLGIDYITDLPSSDSHTCILVMDRFSKSCKLIPLKGIPLASDTTQALFNHVFRNFGIPEDIVSDHGPQFIWQAFCSLLGVTLSLYSGYHLQPNGQTERKIQEIGWFLRTFCHDHQQCQQWTIGFVRVRGSGTRSSTNCIEPFGGTSTMPTPDATHSILHCWPEGVAIYKRHRNAALQQEIESPFHWPLLHHRTGQSGHLSVTTSITL